MLSIRMAHPLPVRHCYHPLSPPSRHVLSPPLPPDTPTHLPRLRSRTGSPGRPPLPLPPDHGEPPSPLAGAPRRPCAPSSSSPWTALCPQSIQKRLDQEQECTTGRSILDAVSSSPDPSRAQVPRFHLRGLRRRRAPGTPTRFSSAPATRI